MLHAVGLVPGFFGFSKGYWGPRFHTQLHQQLASRGHDRVPIHPLGTSPIGSLATRQKKLRKRLARHEDGHATSVRWHLVGHSTGGLDAALLLASRELELDRDWGSRLSSRPLTTTNVGSVTTLAAPLQGTGLAMEAGAPHVLQAGVDAITRPDGAFWSRLAFARAGFEAGVSWRKLVFHDELARDLRIDRAAPLVAEAQLSTTPLFSIATCAPRPADNHPDPLFRDLWRWTAAGDNGAAVPAIAPLRWIGHGTPPALDPAANDGVVNTRRQAIGKLVAIVVGDHGDVIGRYRRTEAPTDAGLLMSDARFGDDQLDQLVACIAECIDAGIRA